MGNGEEAENKWEMKTTENNREMERRRKQVGNGEEAENNWEMKTLWHLCHWVIFPGKTGG